MNYRILFFGMLLTAHAYADSSAPIIPLDQKLTVVDYTENGKQTGCGLRATGTALGDVSLNVLITVFMKGTGSTFGVIKVVARKIKMKNGVPELHDGKITYTDIGNIENAWIKSYSGKAPLLYRNGVTSHGDAYMVTADFSSTVDMMATILQESFTVGIQRAGNSQEQMFRFDQALSRDDGYKLSVCMKNLRAEIEDSKAMQNF